MAEKKKISKEVVKRSILDRMLQLILENILHKVSASDFWKQICEELKEGLQSAGYKLIFATFREWLDDVLWKSNGTEKTLITILKERVSNPDEEFQRLNPHIPLELIQGRIKELRGLISAPKRPKFVRGILHIDFLEDLKIRELFAHKFSNPFIIPTVPDYSGMCVVANGTNLGILHTPIIAENIVRLAFSEAERIKSRGLFIPGGMFELDIKKA